MVCVKHKVATQGLAVLQTAGAFSGEATQISRGGNTRVTQECGDCTDRAGAAQVGGGVLGTDAQWSPENEANRDRT
jgi:hypothetical protein